MVWWVFRIRRSRASSSLIAHLEGAGQGLAIENQDGAPGIVAGDLEPGPSEHGLRPRPKVACLEARAPARIGLDPTNASGTEIGQNAVEKPSGQAPPPVAGWDEKAGDRPGFGGRFQPMLMLELGEAVSGPDLAPAGRLAIGIDQVAVILAGFAQAVSNFSVLLS
jgi:hypothetical protein